MTRRELIRIRAYPAIMAEVFQVQGTRLHVIELVMFGFASSSRYVLLRAVNAVGKLTDEKTQTDLSRHPSKYGRKLELGKELAYDEATRKVYYLPEVSAEDMLPIEGPIA